MPTTTERATLTVALIGNPNTGKSTLFTALAGVRQRVGNYPGVTVEKKIGQLLYEGQRFELVDLPGTYSLAPRSPDEMVAVDVLLGRRTDQAPPDAVVCIVDAANLERNLYLVSQVLELGLPTVLALNMVDLARDRGVAIDLSLLRQRLGIPVVEVQANRRRGIIQLKSALAEVATGVSQPPASPFPPEFQHEVRQLEDLLAEKATSPSGRSIPRYLVERLLLDSSGYLESALARGDLAPSARPALAEHLKAARARLAAAGFPVPAVEAMARYGWVSRVLDGVITRPEERRATLTDSIDRVLTHRFWGTAIFAVMMLVLFSSVFTVAATPMEWIGAGIDWVGARVETAMAEGALRSLLVDGVIGGVGGVVVFLPQILILFFFIAVLEDCGYMARAAYLMDKLMVRVGLSGKSFIPLLSSFACAIPGVMATRVIENRRDRLTTILVAPLMSCSARLPVYTVLIGAFIPQQEYLGGVLRLQGLTLFGMYLVGIVAAMLVALALKKTILRGPTPAFVLELPSYKWPSVVVVCERMLDRGWAFILRAGTLILAVSMVVWAAAYYPHNADVVEAPFKAEQATLAAQIASLPENDPKFAATAERLDELENEIAGAYQRQSWLGRAGRFIEPVFRPLGWDWRISCAALASFPAREVIIGTLGVIYNLGDEVDEGEGKTRLERALKSARWDGTNQRVYNVPVALSIMVFFALCAQCAATLAVIKRETNSWRWPVFTFVYMTVLAYVGALVTYQVGMWLA